MGRLGTTSHQGGSHEVALCSTRNGCRARSRRNQRRGTREAQVLRRRPGTCSVSQDTATLDTSDGGFAGAYYTASKANGTPLTGVDYAFQYNCDPSDDTVTCVGGGSPRWSIPIDTPDAGKTNGYAFIGAANCGSTGTVSTTSATCAVNFASVDYANWDAFAAANPSYQIGNALPFRGDRHDGARNDADLRDHDHQVAARNSRRAPASRGRSSFRTRSPTARPIELARIDPNVSYRARRGQDTLPSDGGGTLTLSLHLNLSPGRRGQRKNSRHKGQEVKEWMSRAQRR